MAGQIQYHQLNDWLFRAVDHIFSNFLQDKVQLVMESSVAGQVLLVSVDLRGSIKGELIYRYSKETIKKAMKHISPNKRGTKENLEDVASELSNMITGSFINQLQYADYELRVTPPEIQEGDEEYVRALYESLALSFTSSMGPFDMDLYYREEES